MNGLALCAGIGGLELGLKIALGDQYRTVCYVEGEAYAAADLRACMEDKTLDDAPIWSDVRTFNGTSWRGKVDIISAGYPCQPFSVAGRQRGTDDPRHLWPDVRRILKETGASYIFCENVAGHLRIGFKQVRAELREMGYNVQGAMFSTAEIGSTHRRERLFFLGDNQNFKHRPHTVKQKDENVVNSAKGGCGQGNINPSQRWRANEPKQSSELPRIPIWPPGPAMESEWQYVLDRWPEVEPAVRGMVDGIPSRVDRLRALGNAVVPVVAAVAFVHLWNRLNVG